MQQVNLHQQKLIALIIAGVCFISLIFNWSAPKANGFFQTQSQNGFHSWGLLCLLGIVGVVAATLMGNKLRPYEGQTKQIAMGAFGVIILGAIVYLIRLLTGSQDLGFGTMKFSDVAKPGIGLFLCLILSVAGLAWVYGLIKMPAMQPHAGTPPPPPPPPPPKA